MENVEKLFYDQFGVNAGYVADQYERYLEDSNSVGDYWKKYFKDFKAPKESPNYSTPIKSEPTSSISDPEVEIPENAKLISGVKKKIIENMESSLSIPTATSFRSISVKLLEENRRIINYHLKTFNQGKISYSHIVAFAIVVALRRYPSLNNAYASLNGKPHLIDKEFVNLGIAVDTIRKDGSRSLIVPNIKIASRKNFMEFKEAYDQLVQKARTGNIEPEDFQDTTITLTNPGGMGTVASVPRLMTDQACIIAVGAIDYPAEFKAMTSSALASLGVGKVMTVTNTYDHRIVQGAESGLFLNEIDALLRGENDFYREIFNDLRIPQMPVQWGVDTNKQTFGSSHDNDMIEKQAQMPLLVNIYRVRGHLNANLNPLSYRHEYFSELDPATYGYTIWDYDREFISNFHGLEKATLREVLDALRQTYCETIGAEFMHIQNPTEKKWLMNMMETVRNKPSIDNDQKIRIMKMLSIAEGFEHFLHTRFIGHKRFSLEGSETLIPVLDHLLDLVTEDGIQEVVMGMAHRGRLNVLANITGKTYEQIFAEFEDDLDPDLPQGTGDVKYHLGVSGSYETFSGKKIEVTLASNPSHLEFVNPVVEGITRAKQTRNNDSDRNIYLPLLIHGDAAFAGQGVVAETLNLSQLKGYKTGGTIHIIVNNQIGFTTAPEDARSSPYATDVAKMVQAPILHVNGDDPEASLWATKIAVAYRQTFKRDIVIDLWGYRRHGHNEGDDPAFTQPILYRKIKSQPSVRAIYKNKLITENVLDEKSIKEFDDNIYSKLNKALEDTKKIKTPFFPNRPLAIEKSEIEKVKAKENTSISEDLLASVVESITSVPEGFKVNPKIKKSLDKRQKLLSEDVKIDWAFAESLAFGTLLKDGFPVRLSGQDSARGTFSQRHLVLTDMNSGEDYIPLNSISESTQIEALDSLLSEAAVLGFEYGYSAADPLNLVMWEAQFGDFANGAQVIIDNFIAASEVKWNLPNNIVMLLPHGQEGQGPEHSSARLERFLILCAENNMIVANPTTPAQYFHLLRKHILAKVNKPLVVFTPKSLLRLPIAQSSKEELLSGNFEKIIDDNITGNDKIKNVLITSGKVYYDLEQHRSKNDIDDTAIIRIEQYYPLDQNELKNLVKKYSNAKSVKWVQEEPKNMGAWNYMANMFCPNFKLEYCGREESPSPAFGSTKIFFKTQNELMQKAFFYK